MHGRQDRKTTFISTADALAIERAPSKGKKPGPTLKLSAAKAPSKKGPAAKQPVKTAVANGTEDTPDASRFYTEEGLRIGLYGARGKRMTHARDGRVMLHKSNKKTVLNDLVRKYAGEAMARSMERWTVERIGDWITEKETRAFGNPPRKVATKGQREEKAVNGAKQDESASLELSLIHI